MNKRIAYPRSDGGIDIIVPAPEFIKRFPSVEDALNFIKEKDIPASAREHAVVLNDVDIPADRTFRNAWELSFSRININMPKAREIQKERWRKVRQPLLEALDIEYQRADEKGDMAKKQQIAVKKQALRDVTKIDLSEINSPEELANYWPEILKSHHTDLNIPESYKNEIM